MPSCLFFVGFSICRGFLSAGRSIGANLWLCSASAAGAIGETEVKREAHLSSGFLSQFDGKIMFKLKCSDDHNCLE